jgi:hypothetical protein
MKKIVFCFYVLVCITMLNSCRKNDTITPPVDTTVNDSETVTASVRGVVVNENEIPVMGATVTLGAFTATTNAYGIFEFRNKSISKNNTHVKVVKTGYFNGNRSMLATAGRTHQVRIKLQPKTITGTVNATSGGAVSLASGGKVTFPANAIVDASGTAYTGTVNVAMAYINPLATDLGSTIQGDLRGVNTNGSETVLETYGMLGVELTSASGQPLKITTGKTAEISNPIPAALQATAPATIPLWHFDETKGRWMEEGSATKVGNNYVGNVSHFSFWNCDVPANFVVLCVNVINNAGQPLNNVQIRIRKANSPVISATGTTDSLGNVCGAVFKNEPLILEVLDRCGNMVYTQNIGPYNANASVNITATIPQSNTITLTGNVNNCSNTAVTNGSVFIVTNNGYNYFTPITATGSFSVTIINCSGVNVNYSVLPIDYNTQQQGAAFGGSASTGTINLGTLQACGTSTTQYINTLIDGVPYTWATPIDSIYLSQALPISSYTNSVNMNGAKILNNGANVEFYQSVISFNEIVGTYPLFGGTINVRLANNTTMSSQQINSPNPQFNLTAIGAPGTGFIEGNYNITMLFNPGNVTRNVQCNFKVKRQ